MTPERLRECIAILGVSQRGLASVIDRSENSVRQWARGRSPIPAEVADWLERYTEFMRENPRPKNPRKSEEDYIN